MTNRKRPVRAVTVPLKKLTISKMRLWTAAEPLHHDRPVCRKDCERGLRPCPYVGCRYHLYLDVNEATGSIKINFPDIEVEDMEHTCVLDMVKKGEGHTLEEVGEYMNLTRERIRQLEVAIKRKLIKNPVFASMKESALEWLAVKSDHSYRVVTNGQK